MIDYKTYWDERVGITEVINPAEHSIKIELSTRTYPITFGYKASSKYIRETLSFRYGFTSAFIDYLLEKIDELKDKPNNTDN